MSHTEYILDDSSSGLSGYDMAWASMTLVAVAACIYIYVLPRFKKRLKTF